jgi:hypothetical protein
MVADKFLHVHQVICAEALKKGRIGGRDDEQWERQVPGKITRIERKVRIKTGLPYA